MLHPVMPADGAVVVSADDVATNEKPAHDEDWDDDVHEDFASTEHYSFTTFQCFIRSASFTIICPFSVASAELT